MFTMMCEATDCNGADIPWHRLREGESTFQARLAAAAADAAAAAAPGVFDALVSTTDPAAALAVLQKQLVYL